MYSTILFQYQTLFPTRTPGKRNGIIICAVQILMSSCSTQNGIKLCIYKCCNNSSKIRNIFLYAFSLDFKLTDKRFMNSQQIDNELRRK